MADFHSAAEPTTLELAQVRMQLQIALLSVADCSPSSHTADEMCRLARVKMCLDAAVKQIGQLDPHSLPRIRPKAISQPVASQVLQFSAKQKREPASS